MSYKFLKGSIWFLLVGVFFISFPLRAQSEEISKIYREERQKQGDLHWKRCLENFKERNYNQAEEDLKLFLTSWHRHPKEMEARKLLSQVYIKKGQTDLYAKNELEIYRDYPNTEIGLESYLASAKAYVRLGREKEAVLMLEDITQNHYSTRISQEAELEKKQLEFLKEVEK